ncbi:hypothetical protein [Erwinia amylovora]|uniref:Uncharacterized protein n=3 Tax=Erwinia amylovora TaxID=552 RepID=A0A830ZZ14_ERWAM|nr:hypothetical protein [Erwinia amylovora]CDK16946.1 hypothetical protein LA635_3322 [Erwinia amylovora LA635]CDK20314.1 hypothetical protein LA636_3322 [Erwinia amylovora LA636]CDK23685.1 hypothetical protein LA637_3325 [Erwinia amylovora LA637]ATZ13161.1 hypothetical protein AD997_17660 [Erwinia amylovora]EKV52316.1 hypothetical protein EaACW_3706 [Erwinia amylovora ACW56400]
MHIKHLHIYINAHVFRSPQAAVKLAEKYNTEKNLNFAGKLLSAVQARPDLVLDMGPRFNRLGHDDASHAKACENLKNKLESVKIA